MCHEKNSYPLNSVNQLCVVSPGCFPPWRGCGCKAMVRTSPGASCDRRDGAWCPIISTGTYLGISQWCWDSAEVLFSPTCWRRAMSGASLAEPLPAKSTQPSFRPGGGLWVVGPLRALCMGCNVEQRLCWALGGDCSLHTLPAEPACSSGPPVGWAPSCSQPLLGGG